MPLYKLSRPLHLATGYRNTQHAGASAPGHLDHSTVTSATLAREGMPPAVADQAPPPPPPRSPHRGNGGGATPQSPLRIKQDGKFYERLLTRESSGASLSFRYYWAEPGAVPFVWESQPGTPKDVSRMAGRALPAITPPPSYLLRHGDGGGRQQAVGASARHDGGGKAAARAGKKRRRCRLRRIRIGFFAGIFRRLSLAKAWPRPAPPVWVSSSSRWLFSSVSTERDEHEHEHEHGHGHGSHREDETAAVTTRKAARCSSFPARPSPWLLRFGGSGSQAWA